MIFFAYSYLTTRTTERIFAAFLFGGGTNDSYQEEAELRGEVEKALAHETRRFLGGICEVSNMYLWDIIVA